MRATSIVNKCKLLNLSASWQTSDDARPMVNFYGPRRGCQLSLTLFTFFYYVMNLLSMLRLLTNSQTFVPAIITTDIAYCVNITTIDIVFFFNMIWKRDSNCHQIASASCNLPRTIDWLLHVINFLIFILKMLQRTPRFLPCIYCFAPFHNLLCSFLYLFLSCTYCQIYHKT